MNPYFLIITCAFVFAGQAIFFKMFSARYRRGFASHFLNNILFLGLVAIIAGCVNGWAGAGNPQTYIYTTFFGVFLTLAFLFFVLAMGMGPTGLVTLFFSFGIVLPIIADLTLLGTLINVFQIIGLALLFISFYIGNRPSGGEKKNISLRFIAVCICSLVFNGLAMATAKLHQGALPGVDVHAFVLYSFITGTLLSVLLFIFFHIRESKKEKLSYMYMFKSPGYYLSFLGSGTTTAVGNIFMITAASLVPAAIQFPLMNGGTAIITAILSIFIYKEKLTKKMALVFVIGIAALTIINL
jgi:drug/metabolite transporter (DMT)-like permease